MKILRIFKIFTICGNVISWIVDIFFNRSLFKYQLCLQKITVTNFTNSDSLYNQMIPPLFFSSLFLPWPPEVPGADFPSYQTRQCSNSPGQPAPVPRPPKHGPQNPPPWTR